MANCLARLDIANRALGHPHGPAPGRIRRRHAERIERQAPDLQPGRHRTPPAVVTVNRLKRYFGLDRDVVPADYTPRPVSQYGDAPAIVITCVDSALARREIHRGLFSRGSCPACRLDLGNAASSAQVVLGPPEPCPSLQSDGWNRLPCVSQLIPQLLEEQDDDDTPSCSGRISLASRGHFVNDMAAHWAALLLHGLFQRPIMQHGVLVNLATKRAAQIGVNPAVRRRLGIGRRKPCGLPTV